MPRSWRSTVLALALPASLAAFLAPKSAAEAGAQETLRPYAVDQDASSLWIRTHRAGLLSFLGHEHAIIPLDWSATLCAADPVPASAHGSVAIRTASLVIDSDSARALAGLGGGPGEDDRAELSENLLGPDGLDAQAHPDIELRVDSVATDDDGALEGFARLTVRGITRDIPITLEEVESSPDGRLTLVGRATVRQRDFGIEPESVAFVVKVADEVDLHMRLVAAVTEGDCEPSSSQVEQSRPAPDPPRRLRGSFARSEPCG